MRNHDLRNATSKEKREAVAQILEDNPGTTARRITELTGIPKSTAWQIKKSLELLTPSDFENEKELEDYVRENSSIIFGEKIEWIDSWKQIYGKRSYPMTVDLFGRNTSNEWIIVEVKMLKNDATRYDRAREAIGQVLHYLYTSIYDLMNSVDRATPIDPTEEQLKTLSYTLYRLFIVSAYHSPDVENMCRLLRAYGIDIEYRSVEDVAN